MIDPNYLRAIDALNRIREITEHEDFVSYFCDESDTREASIELAEALEIFFGKEL